MEEPAWERVVRDSGARSREELLADIGLGKRLPAVVAGRLTKTVDVNDAKAAASRSAAPKAWRYSSPPAAGRFRAMRSSARSRRAKGWWCTLRLRRPCARARTSRSSGSTWSGTRAPRAPVGGDQRHGGEPARRARQGGFRDRRRGLEHRFHRHGGRPPVFTRCISSWK